MVDQIATDISMVVNAVIANFNLPSVNSCTALGNAGGFGGSEIWKLLTAEQAYCLKRWPLAAQDKQRIDWIHRVLIFAAANGCHELATPITTETGRSYVQHADTYWELNSWADGEIASNLQLCDAQISAAIDFLARFHHATARFHFNFQSSQALAAVQNRLLAIENEIATLDASMKNDRSRFFSMERWTTFKNNAPRIAKSIADFLVPSTLSPLPVQPVIRDIRDDHLFYNDKKLTKVIDFGAMSIDSVAFDLARMLGSFFEDDVNTINRWLDGYSQSRQLGPAEREIVIPLIKAGVILGIMNWLKWLHIDRRQFESEMEIAKRLKRLFQRFCRY